MSRFYVHFNGAAWFVKTEQLFEVQGGLTSEWGRAWYPLEAASIEDARFKAEREFRQPGQ